MVEILKRDTNVGYPQGIQMQNRREAIFMAFGALLGSTIVARSQSVEDFEVLQKAFDAAFQLRSFAVTAAVEEFDNFELVFLQQDYLARSATLDIANLTNVFEEIGQVEKYVFSLPGNIVVPPDMVFDEAYVSSMFAIASQIEEDGLPIAPSAQEVAADEIAVIPPQEVAEDSDLRVVVDILLETIGISVGDTSLIVSAIESDERLRQSVNDLLSQISSKDWQEVIATAEVVFKLLVGSRVWQRIKEIGGRKLSWRLGLKAVPVVGWIYCGAAFVVAVKLNYNRFSFA
jgi:hypothetical protein